MAYGYNNRDFKNYHWGLGIANMFIVAFCIAIPGMVFVYLIGLIGYCNAKK